MFHDLSHRAPLPPSTIRVLWVDDCPRISVAWSRLIDDQADMKVVVALLDTRRLIEAARFHEPHVVVMDLDLAGQNGIDLLPGILDQIPALRVLIYSGSYSHDIIERCLDGGAWGLIGKHADPSEVLRAIRCVANGEVYFPR